MPAASELESHAPELPASPEGSPGQAPVAGPDWLIEAKGVRKKFCRDLRRSLWYSARDLMDALLLRSGHPETLREFEFWAVDDVSFQLRRGDSLGLLGRNGAGKSTLLKLITGQRTLSAGTVRSRGRIVAMTELGLGFNPVLTGRENAYVNAAVHGFSRRQFEPIIEQIIDFSEIREFIDSAVQTYSSGMKARLGFAIATHLNADILVVDEVLAVGDLDFRRKCVKHILAFVRGGGSVILVAHDPYLVQAMCNRCIVLDRGRLVFDGSGIDGVNFHFELGRHKQYANIADAAERAMADATDYPADHGESELLDEPLPPGKTIVLDSIEVVGNDGGPPRAGHPARVVLRYRSNATAEYTWGFAVCTPDLQTSIFSCAQGMDGGTVTLGPGKGSLICRLPDFPLLPGNYAIRGGLADAATMTGIAIRGYGDAPFFFSVQVGEINRTNNFKLTANDLVSTKAEWL